ncbi:hypothetical protein LVJ94_36695 [Pendulispora rubella]|uniref:Uncharacterized protein n=1 Tax=Pendulispora rubella TaxID=2741070 RepID=A0ABZ2KXG1_9BACT
MKDTLTVLATVLFFALLVTVHVAIAAGLSRRPPRARALLALVAFPLAPYFALREQMRLRAVLWLLALFGYGAALVVSFLGR